MKYSKMRKEKLIIFDVDNTLIRLKEPFTYVWEIFNTSFDVSDKDYILYGRWKRGEIKYPEWIKQDLELYIQKGANKMVLENLLLENTSVEKGTSEILKQLKAKGDYIGIVSGSVDIMLNVHDLNEYMDKVHINRINYNKFGEIIPEGTYHTDYDGTRKINGVLEMCYHFGIPLRQCTYIGDGDNDIPVSDFLNQNGGTSISFNGSDELNGVATYKHIGDFINLQTLLL